MENNRRNFLKIAGIAVAGLSAKPLIEVIAASNSQPVEMLRNDKALKAKRWGMIIDTRKYQSKQSLTPIIEACHQIHNVPNHNEFRHRIQWIWEEEFKHAFVGDDYEYLSNRVKDLPFLVMCNHCENPPCVRACPTQATFKREDGIVLMDFHRCIGCRFCMAACPYGSRSFNFRDPRPFISNMNKKYPTRMKGVVEKCNFCADRLANGQMPACVEASKGILTAQGIER